MKQTCIAIAVFCICLSTISYSQSVDPLTGRAVAEVPFFQLSAGDISIPIGINHHGNAMQVLEGEGSCGVAWNLNGVGMLGREVRGLPDDYYGTSGDNRRGWLFNSNAANIQSFAPAADDDLSNCVDETNDYNFLNGLGYVNDPEPDLFYFYAPGVSGQFILDQTGTAKLLNHQDLQITVTRSGNNPITAFTIKTNEGIIYTFNVTLQSARKSVAVAATVDYFTTDYQYYLSELSYTSSWYLASIQSQPSGISATYAYQNGEETTSPKFVTRILGTSTTVDTLYFLQDKFTAKNISQISLRGYTATFTWLHRMVKKITIAESETGDAKEFELVHKTLFTQGDNIYPKASRAFLKEVKQKDNCIPFPSYSFEYDGVNFDTDVTYISWDSGNGQDYFGFNNGQSSNKTVPKIYYYANESGARRFRTDSIPGVAHTTLLPGDNRAVNTGAVSAGSLVKISYPTGGVTLYEYEPNRYYDTSTGQEFYGGGVRVASVYAYGGKQPQVQSQYTTIRRQYEYKLANNSSSGKLLYPAVFAFADGTSLVRSTTPLGSNVPEVLYSRVTEIVSGKGKRVYEFRLPGTYPQTTDATWKATPSKIARSGGGCTAGNLKNGAYTYPFLPVTNYDFKRGALMKEIEYAEDGKLVRQRRLSYTAGAPATTIFKGVRFEKIGSTFHYGQYEIITNASEVVTSEVLTEVGDENAADSVWTTITYTYNSRNQPTLITRTNKDNSNTKEKFKYAGDYNFTTPPASDTTANAIKDLNANFRHAEVIERITYMTPVGGSQKVTGGQLTLFRNWGGTTILPYRVKSLPQGVSLTESAVSGSQTFSSDADYITVTTVEDYANGIPVNMIDNKKNRAASIFSSQSFIPVLGVADAKASHVVFDDFELPTARSTYYTGTQPYTTTTGWTGAKAAVLTSAQKLNNISIVKGQSTYRVSLWAKAGSAATITVQAKSGVTLAPALTLQCPGTNQWTYLTGEVNVSTLAATFALEISSNATVSLDDVLFLPRTARASAQTVRPLTGVTSTTDERGNSAVVTYDALGREVNVYDHKRNLVKFNEYAFQKESAKQLNSGFTASTGSFKVGQTTVFNTAENCIAGATFSWTVINPSGTVVATQTGTSLSHAFTTNGQYNIKLNATHPQYGSSETIESICVTVNTIDFLLSVTPNTVAYKCDPQGNPKTFNAHHITGCADPQQVTYTWYHTDAQGQWVLINGQTTSTLNFGLSTHAYQVKCVISLTCGTESRECTTSEIATATKTVSISFVDNSPCQ